MVLVSDREVFIEQVCQDIDRRVREEEKEDVKAFCRLLFQSFPLEDLQDRDIADIFGMLYSCWSYVQEFDADKPKIAVFNPSLDLNGWRSGKTIVQVLSRDMAFLVSSVMGELNDQNITIRAIHNTVLHTRRDEQHRLLEVRGRAETVDGFAREALIYLEITRNSSETYLNKLMTSIGSVLSDVQAVVDDFQAMGDVAQAALVDHEQVPVAPESQERHQEEIEFLQWMLSNHFTFLGCRELTVTDGSLSIVSGSDRGLVRQGYGFSVDFLQQLLANRAEGAGAIQFGRYRFQSRVHRRSYPDMILVWRYDAQGQLQGARCFMGLFTSAVHTGSVNRIPLVNSKLRHVLQQTGYEESSHNGREIVRIMETFPRGELFRVSEDKLFNVTRHVFLIRERRQVRVFMDVDVVFGFASCLVYVPRNLFNTALRIKLQTILADALGAIDVNQTIFMSESVLTRVHFLFRIEPGRDPGLKTDILEQEMVNAARSWEERLRDSLIEEFGEEQGSHEVQAFLDGFPPGYQYEYEPRVAVGDIRLIRSLTAENNLGMSISRAQEDSPDLLHFRLLREGSPLILSDVIPILENFGLQVVAESSHLIAQKSGEHFCLQEFTVRYAIVGNVQLEHVTENFKQAFYRIWCGDSESDAFNKLLLGAQIDWRQVAVVRAYARYMKQLAFQYSEAFIAETLCKHLDIAREIVRYFEVRFTPGEQLTGELLASAPEREQAELDCRERILASLDKVASLNEDGVVRHYLALIEATLRTNYFQHAADRGHKNYISLKVNTAAIEDAPRPRPEFEIFVYSPRVEGVHLRGGPVARGGLRWSDRYEDFRTEVLGLVKAQQVKNAIIVPVGAKGGFICKRQPQLESREEKQKEGVACYKTFIRGLLDITDNLVGNDLVPAPEVERRDGDDPYLVVAADKGTATFSDTANAVAEEYGFWLGDAFASGGQYGYDHKKMGITAKGAWVCTQRHFRELGVNIQESPFTVVGIGDMSGDVFGNGMLLSPFIKLTAAFNHLHIFIDPNPDPALSFAERQRLFDLPRSGWPDYDTKLISEGGGVFSRSLKSIPISPQMRECFAIEQEALTPAQLIKALLQAPVDLLWNGGIGTYVKSSAESHTDVGDKANDAVRVDAPELRARVVGEGGNLGLTQLARVEYCLADGAVNTDFIDNAGGVDCSDYEVNIKILLNDLVATGDLTTKQRNQLLSAMTDDISELVLGDCDRQARAISVVQSRGSRGMEELLRFIQSMVNCGRLDRELEFIPDDETLRDRRHQGKGFTRPELAVLSAYSKALLKETLATGPLPDEPCALAFLEEGFPARIADQFGSALQNHRLRKQIIAKNVANEMIDSGGITFAHRMRESTGADDSTIAIGFIFARAVFRAPLLFEEVSRLNYRVDSAVQYHLMDRTTSLLRGATRWFLRNRRQELPLGEQIDSYSLAAKEIWDNITVFLNGAMASYWDESFQKYKAAGVGDQVASFVAGSPILFHSLNVVDAAQKGNKPLLEVAELFFRIGEDLGLTNFSRQIVEMKIDNHWQAIAREGLLDDIGAEQKAITLAVLSMGDLDLWIEQRQPLVDRWQDALAELNSAPVNEFAMYSVVLRELSNLARSEALVS